VLKCIAVLPDTHSPFEDQRAWKLVMQVLRWVKPDRVVHLGDWADFYAVSDHEKNPNRASPAEFKREVRHTQGLIREVAAIAPLTYVEGNHENRLTRYLSSRAPELYDLVSPSKLLGLGRYKVQYIPYRQSYRLGRMRFTHDVNGKAGKHAVVGSLEAMGHNVCIGHVHRIGYHVNGNLEGDRHVGISLGWLGDLGAINYLHRDTITKDWALGFGLGYLNTANDYLPVSPIPILPDYTCVVHGRLFHQPKLT
jgi:predicted phosphodiesterase